MCRVLRFAALAWWCVPGTGVHAIGLPLFDRLRKLEPFEWFRSFLVARCCCFLLAVALTPVAYAAPAPELSGAISVPPAQMPVSAASFLQRLRQPVVATPSAADAGYVPRTAHDNSPYRFNMTQNGRRMTAEEFDAWMKARGIRVATGRPAGSAPAPAAPAAATAQACQANATTSC